MESRREITNTLGYSINVLARRHQVLGDPVEFSCHAFSLFLPPGDRSHQPLPWGLTNRQTLAPMDPSLHPIDRTATQNPYSWLCHHCGLGPSCAIHPGGPQGKCIDFRLAPPAQPDDLNQPSTYAGEPITSPPRSIAEPLALLNTHPLFTGRCPTCEMPIAAPQNPWHCPHCGWIDASNSTP